MAAPAGVAEVNDSVTLATRNNNIITVRAIFYLSSLTPELLLHSSPHHTHWRWLSLHLAAQKSAPLGAIPCGIAANGICLQEPGAAGLISTQAFPEGCIPGPAAVNIWVTKNPGA